MKQRSSQHQIIYQNQSHLVQRYFEQCNICPTLEDICLATDLLARFCQEGYTKELSELFSRFDKHIEEKYKNTK
jgi:glutaminase